MWLNDSVAQTDKSFLSAMLSKGSSCGTCPVSFSDFFSYTCHMSLWGLTIYIYIKYWYNIFPTIYIFSRSWYSRFALKTNLLSWWFVVSIPETRVLKTPVLRWNFVLVLLHQMLCVGVIPEPWKMRSEVEGGNGNKKDDTYENMFQRKTTRGIAGKLVQRGASIWYMTVCIYIYIAIYIYRMCALPSKTLWIWTRVWLWTVDVSSSRHFAYVLTDPDMDHLKAIATKHSALVGLLDLYFPNRWYPKPSKFESCHHPFWEWVNSLSCAGRITNRYLYRFSWEPWECCFLTVKQHWTFVETFLA